MVTPCFEELRGTPDAGLYAVLNWQERRDHLDVACYQRLTPEQEAAVRDGRKAGVADLELFGKMFPNLRSRADEVEAVALPLAMLTHEQLLVMVQRRLGREVPGLGEMPLAGLRELWRALR
jgi:hypothetical protein